MAAKKQVKRRELISPEAPVAVSSFEEKKDDYIFDEITGARGKKPALSLLNKRNVGAHEMDELFCDWG